jgi:UV excision repair protein RAD23
MLVTLKPLKGENFQIEIDEEATIGDLKKKVAEIKPEMAADQLKLIYQGKVLQNDNTIKTSNVKAEGFIVCMVAKAAAAAAPPAVPAADSTAAATPAAAPAPAPAPPAPTPAPSVATLPSVITDLRQCPNFHNMAVFVSRNPTALSQMLPALRPNYPELLQAITANLDGFVQMLRAEAGAASGGGTPTAGDAANPMAAAMNNPQMAQMAAMLAQNPAMLQQLAQSDPQIAQLAQQNPQALASLLAMAAQGGGMPGGGMPQAQLTEEDNAAVERLVALGFDKEMVIEVFLGCGKDEQLAASILLDEKEQGSS